MAMAALRSLSQSLARTTTTTTTLRRRPPPRSLHHHHQDNKLMMSSWSTTSRNTSGSGGNSCKGCQDRDRLIDELEQERRRFVRMTTDNKLSGTTSPEGPTGRRWGNYFEYDTPQNFDELVKRYEERRSFNRMVITGAVSAY